MIKTLVISGGGPILITMLGAIQYLDENNIVNIKDIESIYGTSSGAILGLLICLKFDWETINKYILLRPWQDVYTFKIQNLLDAYTKKGIYDIGDIELFFKPLFNAKDIPLDITLGDFYKLTNVELHLFTFEINEYKLHDISYLTHPDLKLLTAIQMSCSIPLLIAPVCIEDKCYIDGGIYCNYPLKYCIESGKNKDEILGFKNNYEDKKTKINADSNLFDFLLNVLFNAILSISIDHIKFDILNEITVDLKYLNVDILKNALCSSEIRTELFNNGIEIAKKSKFCLDYLNAIPKTI